LVGARDKHSRGSGPNGGGVGEAVWFACGAGSEFIKSTVFKQ